MNDVAPACQNGKCLVSESAGDRQMRLKRCLDQDTEWYATLSLGQERHVSFQQLRTAQLQRWTIEASVGMPGRWPAG